MLESSLRFWVSVGVITGVSACCTDFLGVTVNSPGIGILGSSCTSLIIALPGGYRPLGVGSNPSPSGKWK